jgi:hypothetical protein
MLAEHVIHDALAVLRIADVALMQGQRAVLGLDLLAELLGALAVRTEAGGDHRSVRGEGVADRRADPTGASGDQGDPPGEVLPAQSGLKFGTCRCHGAAPF